MLKQLQYQIDQIGGDLGIRLFRPMAHWYLKSMRVKSNLRNDYQKARSPEEVQAVLQRIRDAGPTTGDRTGQLPAFHIPVPHGPNSNW